MKNVRFNNSAGDEVSFHKYRHVEATYDIINWIVLMDNKTTRIKIGSMNLLASSGMEFKIDDDNIQWPVRFNQVRAEL